ncbi:DUF4442 domain-containing protein [Estrella lausannensis]|uniref:Conserved putative membrane protein n=1 Tax=Estrella lausannensis TaxID=483423 RepID=A0A0H5DP46_9BACT|nr:DUF4442 domain-containing protein [Estrella lausannensis]CRX37678.1 Conserved putative membrane protein [Estrella lausannensis]
MRSILQRYIRHLWRFWPPFLFSGIRIERLDRDFRYARVRLKLRFWTANYVGTQFGGSLFSMTDPFYMLMLIKNLGPEYSIWDKSASISYVKPGRSDVLAEFTLSDDDLAAIVSALQTSDRLLWTRQIEIKDLEGEVVARVDKTVSIKKKNLSS